MDELKSLKKSNAKLEEQRKAVRLIIQASDLLNDMIRRESER